MSALVAGVVVLGVGGRLAMFVSRLLHPDAVGRLTEGGNRIGEVTLGGTLGLVVFVGLFSGLMAGVIWALVAMWLPRRWWVTGLATTAIGGRGLVDAGNRDFVILDPPGADVAILLGLVFVFGVALHATDRLLGRRVAPAAGDVGTTVQAVLVLLAASFLVPTLGFFFSAEFCFCDDPPWLAGTGIVLAGTASLWWWAAELRGDRPTPRWLPAVGRAGVGLAVAAGTVDLVGQVATIL